MVLRDSQYVYLHDKKLKRTKICHMGLWKETIFYHSSKLQKILTIFEEYCEIQRCYYEQNTLYYTSKDAEFYYKENETKKKSL